MAARRSRKYKTDGKESANKNRYTADGKKSGIEVKDQQIWQGPGMINRGSFKLMVRGILRKWLRGP